MEKKEGKNAEGPMFRLDLSFQGQNVNDLQGIVNGQCRFTFHCESIAATVAQDRKQKIRQLLASKNTQKHSNSKPTVSSPQFSRPSDRFLIRPPIPASGNPSTQREPVSQAREERSRTRDRAVQNPANTIKDYIAFNEARAKKMSFQPKFNFCDNIFAQYKDVFSIRSGRHEGFMIVNSSPCPPSQCYIKFKAVGLSSDGENDCAVGITFKPQDLVKYNRKIPVDKCMRYFLGSQKLFTGKNSNLISGNLEGEVMLMVDRPNGKFCIYTHSQVILKRSIPNEFLEEELFICIELRNSARLQLL